MIEAVAEADDAVLEKYLEDGEISEAEIFATLRKGVRDDTLLPLLCAAASKNIGGMALMLAAENIFPSAAEAPAAQGAPGRGRGRARRRTRAPTSPRWSGRRSPTATPDSSRCCASSPEPSRKT